MNCSISLTLNILNYKMYLILYTILIGIYHVVSLRPHIKSFNPHIILWTKIEEGKIMPKVTDIYMVSKNLEFPHGCYDSGVLAFNHSVMKSSKPKDYCESKEMMDANSQQAST